MVKTKVLVIVKIKVKIMVKVMVKMIIMKIECISVTVRLVSIMGGSLNWT